MLFPSRKDPVIGVDIGSHSVKVVLLNLTKGGYELVAFGTHELERDTIIEDNIEKPDRVVEAIKTLINTEKIKTKSASVALPGRAVVIKKVSLPASSQYDVGELLTREAEQYIPFDVSEASLDYHIITEGDPEEEGSQREVLLIAAQREKVDAYKSLLSQAGLNPLVVDVDVFAIENGYELNYGVAQDAVFVLMDIGASVTRVSVMEEGVTTFTRDVKYAGDMITYHIRDELDVGIDIAEQLKRGLSVSGISPLKVKAVMTNALGELCAEVKNAFDLFKETSDGEIEKVWLTGGTVRMPGIDRFISEHLGIQAEIINPFKNIKVNEKVFDPEYLEQMGSVATVAVGLATRKFGDKQTGPKPEEK